MSVAKRGERPAPAEQAPDTTANSTAKLGVWGGALLFLAMAVLHSWPLASAPGRIARLDNHDAELNTWIIAWVAHALPRDPLSLFDAPILHPERHSLAFSEHMFVPSVMGAPLLWAGASPVLVYNLLIIAGLALSGWSMYLLMRRWTGRESAGVVAGLAYAFNAHILTRFVHLQAHHVEFFPLMLYAFDRVLIDRRRRDAVLLGGAFVLQSLCSNYLLVFATYSLVVCAAVRWREIAARPVVLKELAIAGAISAIALAPFLWPYYQVSRDQGLVRQVSDVTQYNAGWRDYLATGGRLHFAWWSQKFYEGRTALFPGFTALMLATIALISRRDPRVRMAAAIGVLGVALSLGTDFPGYAFIHQYLPLMSGLRNVARWGWLALAAVAMLAGFGVAALDGNKRRSRYAPIAIAILVTIEAIRTPVGFTPVYAIPRIYDRFAGLPAAVIAEFPFYSGASVSLNGPYVLANTRYFKPLLNGYSSFHPASFEARGRALNSFPSAAALAELKMARVTHVLVHTQPFERRYGRQALEAIDTITALQLETVEDGIRLYRLK
ncbi:MAG TPA: hypothetical protein VFZ31_10185 [Vicinamibacterales bacterium]